jgi:hypothetical protein
MSTISNYENSSKSSKLNFRNKELTKLNNIIGTNPLLSSSTSRSQSIVLNKYTNSTRLDLTDPLSSFKQILSIPDQYSPLNTKEVCFYSEISIF